MTEYILEFLGVVIIPVVMFFMKQAKTKHDETNKIISEQNKILGKIVMAIDDSGEMNKDILKAVSASHDEHGVLNTALAIIQEKLGALGHSVNDIHRRMD